MRKFLLIFLICFLSFVGIALAHTGLESSTPQNGEVITENLQNITLTFEGKLENGSTFTVKNSNEEILPTEISLAENLLIGTLSSPLENGEYQIHWSIIGADGHPIEGDLSFSVNVPVTETPAEESEETPEESHDHQNVDTPEEDTANEVIEEDSNQNEASSYVVPVIIGLLIVIVIGSFIFLMKRKK